jgi:hypothetical protein
MAKRTVCQTRWFVETLLHSNPIIALVERLRTAFRSNDGMDRVPSPLGRRLRAARTIFFYFSSTCLDSFPNKISRRGRTMADARNGDVDAVDHHQESAYRLPGRRAALMRLDRMTLPPRRANRRTTADGILAHQHARGRHRVECWCFDKRRIQRFSDAIDLDCRWTRRQQSHSSSKYLGLGRPLISASPADANRAGEAHTPTPIAKRSRGTATRSSATTSARSSNCLLEVVPTAGPSTRY